MSVIQTFARAVLQLAHFIDRWFYYFLAVGVGTFIYNKFFFKDWDKVLFNACKDGKLKEVEEALQNKAFINCQYEKEKTPLIAACAGNHKDIVIKLLSVGQCKIDQQDAMGCTALYTACKAGNTDIVRILISRGADMKIPNNDGTSPLIAACMDGHESLVYLLLEKGANVQFKNKFGLNCLNAAISHHDQPGGRLNIIKRLLQHKQLNIESRTAAGWTALMKASFKGYEDVVRQLLLFPLIDINAAAENGFTALIGAAQNGWINIVKLLLQRGAMISSPLYDGSTALIAACYGGYTDIVELLTSAETHNNDHAARLAVVNVRYKQGSTALMAAAYKGYVDVAAALVQAGAEVDAVNDEGWTALCVAAEKGCYLISKLLLETGGADPNAMNKAGFTPLMYAAKLGYADIAELLLRHGALVNHALWSDEEGSYHLAELPARSSSNSSSIVISSSGGGGDSSSDIPVAKSLFSDDHTASTTTSAAASSGTRKTFTIIDGYLPPLMLALSTGQKEMVRLLLQAGADVNVNMATLSSLMRKRDLSFANHILNPTTTASGSASTAAGGGSETAAAAAAAATGGGAGTVSGDPKKESPKFKKGGRKASAKDIQAQEMRELRQIEAVLDELQEVNQLYHFFSTPLMYAVFLENAEMVQLLHESAADPRAVNGAGDSALVLAAFIGCVPIVRYLLDRTGAGVPSLRVDFGRTARNICLALLRRGQLGYCLWFTGRYLTTWAAAAAPAGAAARFKTANGCGGDAKIKKE